MMNFIYSWRIFKVLKVFKCYLKKIENTYQQLFNFKGEWPEGINNGFFSFLK